MGTSLQRERCSASETCWENLSWSWVWKEVVGFPRCLVLLSVQNKLLTLMTVLSEMVCFKTVELHHAGMTACSQARQARMGVESSVKGFLACSCFRTGLHIKSCETQGLRRKNWQPEAQQLHLWCWDKYALWHDLEQIWPSYRAMCAWFFCLLLNICLSVLLLKWKAIFCLQRAHGEMLSVSVEGNCTLFCLLLNSGQPLTLCKTLQITVCPSLSPMCPCGSSGAWRSP